MKKWLWIIGGLIAVAMVAGFIFRDLLFFMAFRASVKPATAFTDTIAPPAPDYSKPEHWAALPERKDAADLTPEGVIDSQADAEVDVFFVHPTTYLNSTGWNAPIGYPISSDEILKSMPDIPVCQSATQTGCLVTWNTISDGYRAWEPTKGLVCVNPLTWANDNNPAAFADSLGALSLVSNSVTPGISDGQCQNGMLHVTEIRTDVYDNLPNMGTGNHHLVDYALFWSNIRVNVAERIEAFNGASDTGG